MFSTKNAIFDRLIEKATTKYLLDPDWETNILICDSIRQGDVQPSYAISSIKKKIEDENPHVAKYALFVLESVVKNCGSLVHIEIATRDFMDFLKERASKGAELVKSKIVELVQVWSHAFRNDSSYRVVQDTFNLMKTEGFIFPTLKESDAMFVAEKAPEWRDGELCYRCRISFGPITRKHHCRACGQVFCQKCTAKNSIIPKFGIEKEVRVCDSCFDQMNNKDKEEALPAEYLASSLSKQPQVPPSKTEAEIREEDELQLAIALSQSEAEHKERMKNKSKSIAPAISDSTPIYSVPNKVATAAVLDTSDMDPELARYLNRNYWQQKSQEIATQAVSVTPTTQPSAPSQVHEAKVNNQLLTKEDSNKGEMHEDREEFMQALRTSVQIFVNRMVSNHQRGRNIANDSSVQTLFVTLNAMHPTLIKYIQQQEDTRGDYERMQDKLAQLKDARDALDVLRQEHFEKRRREQEETERLRQIQMANKLEILRQQKQVYLEYQRQMAVARMAEQEGEMRRRLDLQKHEQQMRAAASQYNNFAPTNQGYGMSMPPIAASFSPDASPHHQQQHHNINMAQQHAPTQPNHPMHIAPPGQHFVPNAQFQQPQGFVGQYPPQQMAPFPPQQSYPQHSTAEAYYNVGRGGAPSSQHQGGVRMDGYDPQYPGPPNHNSAPNSQPPETSLINFD